MAIKNWFGIDPHPTNECIHWSNRNPMEEAEKLRKAYGLIAELGVLYASSLNTLLEAAYQSGKDDERDRTNPDL